MEWWKLSRTQVIILFFFTLLCLNYLIHVGITTWRQSWSSPNTEGFEDKASDDSTLYTWITEENKIYDDFYAKIYDQLTQNLARTQGKVSLCMERWSKDKTDPQSWTVLDAGSGTGVASAALAKAGVGNIIAIDLSQAMIDHAKKIVLPETTLTDKQKAAISFRLDDLLNPSACSPEEIKHTICYYFTLYYLKDTEAFMRNVLLWTKSGGTMFLEVVNKYKFDPILDSASPLLGFSIQKYSEERIRKSKVNFTTFDYEAEFMLTDPKAEFRETFRFKDNAKVRRQKHSFIMPEIKEITQLAQTVGWKYEGYIDLTALGFEYAYILMFKKN
jgi:SAM-dependent methyltransferase